MLNKEPLEPDDWILPRKCPIIGNDGLKVALFINRMLTWMIYHGKQWNTGKASIILFN